MDTRMQDAELGDLVVRVNSRARRLVFRVRREAVYVTVPPGTSQKEVQKAVNELREKLREVRERLVSASLIDWNYSIQTDGFQLTLLPGKGTRFTVRTQAGTTQIICPESTDWSDAALQNWMRKVILESLRKQAQLVLPLRLDALSSRWNLPYATVKIRSSQGRWGSCSSRKNINLSFYLLLLPSHLVDYVLLHELCHTREMNHGERFWELLNRCTAGKALALRNELKRYRPEIG